jgi:hypothetical protein
MSTASPHPYSSGADDVRPSYFVKPIDNGYFFYFHTVADMCKSSSATEELGHSGHFTVDSVVLRIMIQQDDCISRVTIDNQIKPLSIGLTKYVGLTSSAPEEYGCGLAVRMPEFLRCRT